ncbi:hypothetical protein C2G38_2029675 [Gigaspora rosea]|uniref:Uncharacterized protein n=1 Tax=Gigaspora rosea TaxID=44941 RepID=A0A397VZ21_9GLOM|nr:hypothetical protein C2G38_2029675 [Gigaspora rosea]
MELFNGTKPLNATTDEVVNEELNELLNALNDAITRNYQDGLSHGLILDMDFSDKAVMELFDDTESLNNVTNKIVNEESTELLNILNDTMTKNYQDSISHGLIFDMDYSDEESDVSSLKITLGQSFDTWNDAETFLNNYGLEKGFRIHRK